MDANGVRGEDMALTIVMSDVAWHVTSLGHPSTITGHQREEVLRVARARNLDECSIVGAADTCGMIIGIVTVKHRQHGSSIIRIFVDSMHRGVGVNDSLAAWAQDRCTSARRSASFEDSDLTGCSGST
jgi:hypothetical protein